MADNPSVNTATAASGATNVSVAGDDIAGVIYQRVKVTFGLDGSASDVSSASPLPVTAATLPLPTGAATETTLASVNTKTPALVSGRVPVDGSGVTQPVSASTLPLPTGAATSAAQTTGNTSLASIDTKTPALSGGKVPVTDPTALPLPAGAATESTLSAINTKLPALVDGSQPVKVATTPGAFQPGYDAQDQGMTDLTVDPDGNLRTRTLALTDEGTSRVNFSNTSLAVAIGTVTLTNGSRSVTWSLTPTLDLHNGDYIKLNADAESAWAQIDSIDSDTSGTLVDTYTGTGGTGAASRALVRPFTGSGGSLAVASGQLTITSGTTNSANTGVDRLVDVAPLVFRARASISQRIANQEVHIGLEEETEPARWFARFMADGTTNTTIKTQTGRNPTGAPSAAEIEEYTVIIPNGLTTASLLDFRIEQLAETVLFFIQGVNIASHIKVIPAQHDQMREHVEIRNGTGVGSSTTVGVDFITCKNHNKLEVGILSEGEKIVTVPPPTDEFRYNVAGVIAINTVLIQVDTSQYKSLAWQCTSMGTTGVVTPEWSIDGTNWTGDTFFTIAGAKIEN